MVGKLRDFNRAGMRLSTNYWPNDSKHAAKTLLQTPETENSHRKRRVRPTGITFVTRLRFFFSNSDISFRHRADSKFRY